MVNLNALNKGLLFLKCYCIHCFCAVPAYLTFKTSVINSYFTLILWFLESQIAELLKPIDFTFSDSSLPSYSLRNVSIFTSSSGDYTFTFPMSPLYLSSLFVVSAMSRISAAVEVHSGEHGLLDHPLQSTSSSSRYSVTLSGRGLHVSAINR